MRTLTFKSFLSSYLKELSAQGTSAPFRLAKELDTPPRLLAPLCLYAVQALTKEQLDRLRQKHPQIDREFSQNRFLCESADTLGSSLEALEAMNPYRKCWNSYLCARDKKQSELHTKQLMVQKIKALQTQYGITNYRVYKSLGLNPGNVNAFLTHEDCTKVSLGTAREILNFVRSYSCRHD